MSGATGDQDEQCAKAGLEAAQDLLREARAEGGESLPPQRPPFAPISVEERHATTICVSRRHNSLRSKQISGLTNVTVRGNTYAWGGFGGVVTSSSLWKSDHPPRHVHVYRKGKLVVKWDLDNKKPMKGAAPTKLLNLIKDLESEGRL